MFGKTTILIFLLLPSLFGQNVEQIIASIWDHLGGKENYQAAMQLSFTFMIEREGEQKNERHHLWDRQNGEYVFEQTNSEGQKLLVFFNTQTKTGTAFENGKEILGEERDERIKEAYAKYINDTYWLLVPAKLNDPGVQVQVDAGRSPEFKGTVLHLSFDKVGLTPGDQYWLYVDKNGSITEWHYVLESGYSNEYLFEDVKDCGAGLRFSTRKSNKNGKSAIVFKNVSFSREVEPERFTPPDN